MIRKLAKKYNSRKLTIYTENRNNETVAIPENLKSEISRGDQEPFSDSKIKPQTRFL